MMGTCAYSATDFVKMLDEWFRQRRGVSAHPASSVARPGTYSTINKNCNTFTDCVL